MRWTPHARAAEALLTAGAGLNKGSQRSLRLRDPLPFKNALDAIFDNVLKGSRLDYVSPESHRPATTKVALPRVFIGSSRESLHIAQEVQQSLKSVARTVVWSQGVFRAPHSALDCLLTQLDATDYGVFVFAPDDVVKSRGRHRPIVRDNVLFEYGLFVGRLGKTRNWFIIPKGSGALQKIASDLVGVTPILYDEDAELAPAIGAAVGNK